MLGPDRGKGQVDIVEHRGKKRDAQGQEMQGHTLFAGCRIGHEAGRIKQRLSALEMVHQTRKHLERRRCERKLGDEMQAHRGQDPAADLDGDMNAILRLVERIGHDFAFVRGNRAFGPIAFVAQPIDLLEIVTVGQNLVTRGLQRLYNLIIHNRYPCAARLRHCATHEQVAVAAVN